MGGLGEYRMRSMAVGALLALTGCAASRAVAPLPKGAVAGQASLGGPLLVFGAPLPVPITTIGAGYGVTDRFGVHGAVHPTGLILFGVVGLDVGASYELVPPKGARPRLMGDLTLSAFAGDTSSEGAPFGVRVFPEAQLVASWDLGERRHHPYVGLDLFTQPLPTPAAYLSPMLGFEVQASRRLGLQVEGKWIAPYASNLPNFVDWVGIAHQGGISAQLGASWHFGETR